MQKWLIKSEPESWSWDDHVKAGTAPWNGVRNHQAANFMKDMLVGDQAFFYHSGKQRNIVGIVEVTKQAYPDPTDESGKFVCVDFKAIAPLHTPVSLNDIKTHSRLSQMTLLKQSRLSVMSVTSDAWDTIVSMAGGLRL